MFEELYEPLPDIDAYLERIGIDRPRPATPEFLDELIYAHQLNVPFENLEVYERGQAVSLAKVDLFDKIVTRKRGGYCFELNGLFFSLLQQLGFDVQPSMARVLIRPNPHPAITHRATIVHFGEKSYLADVGFGGPMPNFAPLLEDGVSRTELGQAFTLHVHDANWWDVGYTGSSGEEQIVLRACSMPAEEQDFHVFSFFQSVNPESVFRQRRQANIRTLNGSRNLMDKTYTEHVDGQKTVFELETEEDYDRILKDSFGIVNWR